MFTCHVIFYFFLARIVLVVFTMTFVTWILELQGKSGFISVVGNVTSGITFQVPELGNLHAYQVSIGQQVVLRWKPMFLNLSALHDLGVSLISLMSVNCFVCLNHLSSVNNRWTLFRVYSNVNNFTSTYITFYLHWCSIVDPNRYECIHLALSLNSSYCFIAAGSNEKNRMPLKVWIQFDVS